MFELSRGRLPWLIPAPEDFRKTVKALSAGDAPVDGSRLVALASHDLDIDGLIALDRAVAKLSGRITGSALGRIRQVDHVAAFLAQCRHDAGQPPRFGRIIVPVLRIVGGVEGFVEDDAHGEAIWLLRPTVVRSG